MTEPVQGVYDVSPVAELQNSVLVADASSVYLGDHVGAHYDNPAFAL